ncbi:hypothetical protein R3P38DRAFT_3260751 [Favolaschia claudopus]|uniref:F-box domain-containing protein n=1 Tax=Favolaschia claudopus TaxID=2862362 RepID=A0AAW0CUV1_9AGAR
MNPSVSLPLAGIATEIWLNCWSFCSTKDLRRLALVCRVFRDICHPLLFQHQRFDAPKVAQPDWPSVAHSLHRTTLRLVKLPDSPHALFVRSWSFGSTPSREYPSLEEIFPNVRNITIVLQKYLHLETVFKSSLGAHRNLRSLYLFRVLIDDALRETLAGLPSLESLELDWCPFSNLDGPLIPLKEFKMGVWWLTSSSPLPFNIVSPPALRTLTLIGDRSYILLHTFTSLEQQFPNLRVLRAELHDVVLEHFLKFLKLCPHLDELAITSFLTKLPTNPLSNRAIPRLRLFKGPRQLAAFFIAGRPVSTIELEGSTDAWQEWRIPHREIVAELADIAKAAPGILSLTTSAMMRQIPDVSAAIATQWPNLRELRLVPRDVYVPPSPVGRVVLYDSDSESEEESDDGEDQIPVDERVDERVVEFSDSESLSSHSSSPEPSICGVLRESNSSEDSNPLPDVLVSGYMYSLNGSVSPMPKPFASPVISWDPRNIDDLVRSICAGRLTFPDTLQILRLTTPDSWDGPNKPETFSVEDEHRIILALETQLPTLRELDFGERRVWRLYRTMWTQISSGAKIASVHHSA